MQDYEKLGSFYLGRVLDNDRQPGGEPLLYDAKDLVTHAICIGMTGSGKTGLCIGLLEEAAIDSIPAIVIDPKGDIGNLLLTFPEMRAEDFRPWIDEQEAARQGLDPEAFAEKTAELWKKGLSSWQQSTERIANLRAAADLAIYTPGSTAGLSVSLLRSFAAPAEEERTDADAMRDRILGAVSSLLALIGIDADPVQSREHILLSNILDHAWHDGRDLSMADIIRAVMTPPFASLGVFDIESFFPEKDRRTFAMQLNNVLASPSFAAWMEGEPLDIERLLYLKDGRPRISIMSIAHLSDAERMFFVTMLLNEVISWMRRQSGSSSLRAILYMDEIFGYFPPSATPPSKKPMLTLLKQARAFGVGCVLATQNPVDLDYKGLGNTGTWFIGRLQTERDKLRLLDGLEGALASAGQTFNRSEIDIILSGLGKRVFLMNNVHDDHPVLFETRWALSYLRGPLSKSHIEALMAGKKAGEKSAAAPARTPGGVTASAPVEATRAHTTAVAGAGVLPGAPEIHFPPVATLAGDYEMLFRPALYARTRLHYVHTKSGVDEWEDHVLLATVPDTTDFVTWEETALFHPEIEFIPNGPDTAYTREAIPDSAASRTSFSTWKKSLAEWIYRDFERTVWQCPELKLLSSPQETEGQFRVRVQQRYHEQRDTAMEKLRSRYAPRYARAQERIRKAEQRVDLQEAQYRQQQVSTAVDIGSTLLGALFGRRSGVSGIARRAATGVGKASRAMNERADVTRAQEDLRSAQEELVMLEEQFKDEVALLQSQFAVAPAIEAVAIKPRKTDLSVSDLALAWVPWAVPKDPGGEPRMLLE
ncbi:MAG: ATP-binding protein [Bacteroidia bacterium]|nr:ATP-binding protein [Bacteroidia bacterium]